MSGAETVSVIVCAYADERWDQLLAALASVRGQLRPGDETIVAVDHNAALARRLEEAAPDVAVVENTGRRGLSGARNAGVQASRGEVVAFLDDDAVAAPGWLDGLRDGYGRPDVLGVGGASEPAWAAPRPGWFPSEFDWVVGCSYTGLPVDGPTPVRNLIGSNMSFRRMVFEELEGFRSDIGRLGRHPAGCEETELCIRIGERWPDARLVYDPAASVLHTVPPERATWRYFTARCFEEGRSKAKLAELVGRRRALASERTYTRRTLPAGVAAAVREARTRRTASPLGRAAAIGVGLALTVAGYAAGRAAALGR